MQEVLKRLTSGHDKLSSMVEPKPICEQQHRPEHSVYNFYIVQFSIARTTQSSDYKCRIYLEAIASKHGVFEIFLELLKVTLDAYIG